MKTKFLRKFSNFVNKFLQIYHNPEHILSFCIQIVDSMPSLLEDLMIFKEYINVLSNIGLFDDKNIYGAHLESIFNQIMTAVFSNGLDKHILIISKALYMLCVKYKIDVDFIPKRL